ncbi:homocysteine S-methyltransferase family protein [Lachnospiraceae bacterium NSJ-143]|nr:homocysteine S-methyltransferase family protein [Lachnospiraceae bacterium NSJ-143]
MELNFLNKHYFVIGGLFEDFESNNESLQKQYILLENNILSIYRKDIISEVIINKNNTFNLVENIADKINIVIKNENIAAALVLPNPPEEISESFDDIYDVYADIAIAAENNGFDLIILDGFISILNLKAALIAVKENTTIPTAVMLSSEKGEEAVKAMVVCSSSLGADIIGFSVNDEYEKLCRTLGECRIFTKVPFMIYIDKNISENNNSKKDMMRIFNEIVENYGVSVIGINSNYGSEYINALNKSFSAIQNLNFGGISVSSISTSSRAVNLNDYKIVGIPKINSGVFSANEIVSEALRLLNEGADMFYVSTEKLFIKTEDELKETIETLKIYVDMPLIIDTQDICLAESAMRIYDGKLGLHVNCKDINSIKELIDLVQRFGAALFISISGDNPNESEYNNYRKNYYIAGMMSDIWRLKKHLIYRDLILGMSVGKKGEYKSLKNIQAILKRIHLNQNCTSFCNFTDSLSIDNDYYEKYSAFVGYVLDRGCTLFFAENGILYLKKAIKLYREIFDI